MRPITANLYIPVRSPQHQTVPLSPLRCLWATWMRPGWPNKYRIGSGRVDRFRRLNEVKADALHLHVTPVEARLDDVQKVECAESTPQKWYFYPPFRGIIIASHPHCLLR
jgi:hypothetical protein